MRPHAAGSGEHLTALCAGALAFTLLLVCGLLLLLAVNGLSHFWPRRLVQLELRDGRRLLGELQQRETAPPAEPGAPPQWRVQLKVGNRDVGGADFVWVDEAGIARRDEPADVVELERLEWGNFYGRMVELRRGDERLASGPEAAWRAFPLLHAAKQREAREVAALEKGPIGEINHQIDRLTLARREPRLARLPQRERSERLQQLDEQITERREEYERLAERLATLRRELLRETAVMEAADGTRKEVPVAAIVRAFRPNALGWPERVRLYAGRLWEFVAGEPRESNTEGGILPAIFGTVMMVFITGIAVTPLGVLAAVYLREYARQGPFVRIVRIAVNNLAGVPSIVFGMVGLGFFVYFLGGTIDRLFYPERLPNPTFGTGGILWASLTLAVLTVPVVIVAAEEGLAAVPRVVREGSMALGATKFETTWRIVVPAAAPGILTGMILAMARAAGEVAPLMIVGMVKLAPNLPLDHHAPFVHLERKFMHLGFHIYDIGFQSPNVEASKPLVFATALLLVLVVAVMNLAAIALRNHLRRRYALAADV
ncbi:MAG: phosphate ABC transporter permease PstA [Acidobacteria bacterium]|nr:phosphate ABC transporter permease PstA [Acidobacteriota bacterium]